MRFAPFRDRLLEVVPVWAEVDEVVMVHVAAPGGGKRVSYPM